MGSNPTAGMDVCFESGRGLCDELITRPEESYRLWCVAECDLEGGPGPLGEGGGAVAPNKKHIGVCVCMY